MSFDLSSKYFFLFGIGGAIYYCLELLYRGFSHWTMFILGGLCFLGVGFVAHVLALYPLWVRMVWCSITITLLELLCGLLVNVWLNMNIWDYSRMPMNLHGQVCLPYTFLWFALSLPALWLNRLVREYVLKME